MLGINSKFAIRDLLYIALGELKFSGAVDESICEEIYSHWDRDLNKLKEVHNQKNGIAVEKTIGYLSFWVRKLQPIAFASPFHKIENEEPDIVITISNNHINELVSLFIIKLLLVSYYDLEREAQGKNEKAKTHFQIAADNVSQSFGNLMNSLYDDSQRSFLQVCLYDMRYRTFGPHHVAHAVRYVMDKAGINFSKQPLIYPGDDLRIGNVYAKKASHVLHMRVFISAPGDVQKDYIKSKKVHDLINTVCSKWITLHGVAVTLTTMQELRSAKDNDGVPQKEIFRQIDDKFDVYFGLISKEVGNPTMGHVSGTMAEYDFAGGKTNGKQNLDGKFIIFGRDDAVDIIDRATLKKDKVLDKNIKGVDKVLKSLSNNGVLYFNWNKKNFGTVFIDQLEKTVLEFKSVNSIN